MVQAAANCIYMGSIWVCCSKCSKHLNLLPMTFSLRFRSQLWIVTTWLHEKVKRCKRCTWGIWQWHQSFILSGRIWKAIVMTLNSDVKRETYIKYFQRKEVERVKRGVKQNSTLCSEQRKPKVFGGNWAKACLKGICWFALAFSNRALPISAPTLESLEDQDDPNPWSWTVGPSSLSKKHKCASTICPQYCICAWSLWSAKAPIIAAIPPVFATLVFLLKLSQVESSCSEGSYSLNLHLKFPWSLTIQSLYFASLIMSASENWGQNYILDSWSTSLKIYVSYIVTVSQGQFHKREEHIKCAAVPCNDTGRQHFGRHQISC